VRAPDTVLGVSAFEGLMATLDYPMFIVTVRAGEERSGCLIGFATQASIHPPRFLAALSDKNHTYRVAQGAEHLAVHFVPEGAEELAELFGGETGDEVDKFARAAWHDGPHGVPILDDCENWFVGRIVERFDFGDHRGHLLEPVAAQHGSEGRVFGFHRAKPIEPGHAP
jgi:flavin reductase (DIM6/NTAB) family NADH-FMN oxidoreductase RutF